MSLNHQPYLTASYKLQRIASGEGEVNFHFDAAIDSSGDDYISSLQRSDVAGDYVASA